MAYMTFICDNRNPWDQTLDTRITYESDNVQLDQLLEDIEDFLRGAGFKFEGKLDIVPADEVGCGGDCSNCKCDNTGEKVMDWTVGELTKEMTKDADQG